MIIQKFSKDAKRGFVIGSNSITPDKIAAGALTVGAAVAVSAVGGLIGPRKTSRAGAKQKKKRPFWLLLMPFVYKTAKSAVKKKTVEKAAEQYKEPQGMEIEVIGAEAISSEEEVYERI